MRRVLAVLVGTGLAVGVGATAWAGNVGAGSDEPKREAAKACLSAARQQAPDADKAAIKEAVKACMKEAGVEGRKPTPEQRAKREALRTCLEGAKALRPDDKPAARAAAQACFEQAGVDRGHLRAKLSGAKECLAEARAKQPDSSKAELRPLVKECLASTAD